MAKRDVGGAGAVVLPASSLCFCYISEVTRGQTKLFFRDKRRQAKDKRLGNKYLEFGELGGW